MQGIADDNKLHEKSRERFAVDGLLICVDCGSVNTRLLEKSDKLRQELLSIIKHEFRTPLVPIKGYCEMLLEQSNENLTDAQQASLNGIFRGIQKFEAVVDKVLDLQALETDKIIFKEEVISVPDFMRGIAGDFSKKITQSGIEFINSSNGVGEIKGDALKLRDIFDYVINNAIDFVPKETGKIEIGNKADEESVIFYIKNNGPEIPSGELQNIFKKFYQIDSSYTRRHQGMGLGLAICKEIIEKHSGKIWCESEEGKETTFYFSIPICKEKITTESLPMTKKRKKSVFHKPDEMKELKQEKIIFKKLFEYLASHEEFSEKIFDAMSHELRTSMVTIKAYTEMLLDGKFGDLTPQQKEKLERIKENIDLLIDTIFSLLHAKEKRTSL